MIIYLITNKTNNKIYVGQTINDPFTRFKEHCWDISRSTRPLQRAINKYGKDNFTIEVLAKASNLEELSKLEKHFIKTLDAKNKDKGYNLTDGGEGASGYIPTEEVRKRISETKKRQYREYIYSHPMKGKVGELGAFFGKQHSIETKQKMSTNRIGENNPFFGMAHPKRIPVIVIDKDLIESRYACAYLAAKDLDLDPRAIHKVCKGKRNTYKGYKFRYEII